VSLILLKVLDKTMAEGRGEEERMGLDLSSTGGGIQLVNHAPMGGKLYGKRRGPMKKIEAIIKPFKLDEVKKALYGWA